MSNYKDPRRKVGSQSETPRIKYQDQNIVVGGYQNFIINKKTREITFLSKMKKFSYISDLLYNLNNIHRNFLLLILFFYSSFASTFFLNWTIKSLIKCESVRPSESQYFFNHS